MCESVCVCVCVCVPRYVLCVYMRVCVWTCVRVYMCMCMHVNLISRPVHFVVRCMRLGWARGVFDSHLREKCWVGCDVLNILRYIQK